MKTRNLFILAAIAIPMVACQDKPDTPAGPDYQELTFEATVASVDGVNLQFNTGESISIFDGKANQKFTAASATSFTGTANANAESFSAVYPYNASYKRTSGKINVTIPSAQTATAGSIDPAANFQVAYAESKDDALNFAFMPALIKLTIAPGEEIVSAQISADGNETLSGTLTLDPVTSSCAKAGEGSNKVTLTSEKLEGTYYVAVIPGTVSAFTVAFTDANDSRCEVKVDGGEFQSGASVDLGTFDSFEWVEAENPNPTDVAKNVIIKASFEEADFNLISEAEYTDQNGPYINSLEWHFQFDPFTLTTTTYNGQSFHRIKATVDAWQWHKLTQVVPLEMYTDYVFSFVGNSNVCPYCGVEAYNEPNVLNRQEIGFAEWRTPELAPDGVNGQYEPNVVTVSKEFNSGDSYFGDCFIGFWGGLDGTVDFRDWKLIPKGYDKKSMKLASVQNLGCMKNATFNDFTNAERFVVWDDATAGTINVACSKATISDNFVDNAVAYAKETSSASAITIGKFNKAKGLVLPAVEGAEGITGMVPDAAINVGGKTYMHYYAETAPGFMRDNLTAVERFIAYSGFVVSEDGGKTWSLPEHGRKWVPFAEGGHADYWPNNYTCFAQASLCQKGDYVYMLGTLPGRYVTVQLGWAETKRTFYAARAAATSDISDPQNWEYWTGTEWVTNEADMRIMGSLTAGTWAEPCVVYNPKFDRFMMIYRSYEGALVFKDADKMEGPWSATKILATDADFGQCYAASVLKVDENGDLYIVASQL